jgi:hypothetical protein
MDTPVYVERITSNRTTALFAALCGFFGLAAIFTYTQELTALAWVGLVLAVVFLFYVVNFHTLFIRLDEDSLALTFGLFTWRVARTNIAAARLDEVPFAMRNGGAGIHFYLLHGRYRASFNFLEFPRVVIALQRPVGPVRDISFTTQQPEEILRRLAK